ncbi:MAG: hypothetical protein M1522_05245 [Actinobacteria bacterium]|jgi:hypothetical protein|nr:hypothetical protein [Actinomycetota bacterium]
MATYWVKKQMRYEGLVQVEADSPAEALDAAKNATTQTAEWVEDFPVETWDVDDEAGNTLVDGAGLHELGAL